MFFIILDYKLYQKVFLVCIKGFAMSKLSRTKTNKVDSALIADFCKSIKPEA